MAAKPGSGHLERRTIGQILETARQLKGISIEKAIRELDTTRPTWLSWRRGAVPDPRWIDTFVRFTGESKWVIMAALGLINWSEAEVMESQFGKSVIPGSLKTARRKPTRNRLAA